MTPQEFEVLLDDYKEACQLHGRYLIGEYMTVEQTDAMHEELTRTRQAIYDAWEHKDTRPMYPDEMPGR